MSAMAQQQEQSQQVQQPMQQQGGQEQGAVPQMESFGAENAVGFQGAYGNGAVAGMAGVEGGQEGASGMDLLAQLDPALATNLQYRLDDAHDEASECGGVLLGTPAESCVQDIYTVVGYIDSELASLQGLVDGDDQEACLSALDRIGEYGRNLSSCTLLARAERDIVEVYEETELRALLTVFAGASAEVAAMKEPLDEVSLGLDTVEAHLATVTDAFAKLEDVAIKAEIDILIDTLTGPIGKLARGFKVFKKPVEFFLGQAPSIAGDVLFELARRSQEESDTQMEDIQEQTDLLNDSVDLEIDPAGVNSTAEKIGGYVEHLEDIDDAKKQAQEGLAGIKSEWAKVLEVAGPKVAKASELTGPLSTALADVRAEKAFADESAAAYRDNAEEVRTNHPDRADRLS